MKKTVIAATLSVIGLCVAASVVFAAQEDKSPESLVGKPAPSVKLKTLDGGKFDLATHKGKEYVVLDFWATWCPWCRKSTDGFVKLSKEYAKRGVRFYIVSVGENADTVRAYAKKHNVDAHFVLDTEGKLATGYLVNYIPHVVLIDKEGKVKKVAIGGDAVHNGLAKALKEIFPKSKEEAPAPEA